MERINVTCRLPAQDVAFLDRIATALERDRSYLIKKAVEEYIESQRWLIEQVEKSIAQADAGEFASDADVKAAFAELRS